MAECSNKPALVPDSRSDEALAGDAAGGCEECFDELVGRYERRIYGFLRARLGSDDDVEDLLQEVFLAAFRGLTRFECEKSFRTWLFTIASRKVVDYYRARRTTDRLDFDLLDLSNPCTVLSGREEKANLWDEARCLVSSDQFEMLWLKYVEHMSVKEIAGVKQKSVAGVKVQLFRARSRLASAWQRNRLDSVATPADMKGAMCHVM